MKSSTMMQNAGRIRKTAFPPGTAVGGEKQPRTALYCFTGEPGTEDYEQLAGHLESASPGELHPALFGQRDVVARRLRQMANAPDLAAKSAYHALRLFVF